jgi:hypothetical protein
MIETLIDGDAKFAQLMAEFAESGKARTNTPVMLVNGCFGKSSWTTRGSTATRSPSRRSREASRRPGVIEATHNSTSQGLLKHLEAICRSRLGRAPAEGGDILSPSGSGISAADPAT